MFGVKYLKNREKNKQQQQKNKSSRVVCRCFDNTSLTSAAILGFTQQHFLPYVRVILSVVGIMQLLVGTRKMSRTLQVMLNSQKFNTYETKTILLIFRFQLSECSICHQISSNLKQISWEFVFGYN